MKQFLINKGWSLLAPIWYTLKGLAMIMVPVGIIIGVFAILTKIVMKVFNVAGADAVLLTLASGFMLALLGVILCFAHSIGKGYR